MENKRFNYVEFKLEIINNELQFLEKYLLEKKRGKYEEENKGENKGVRDDAINIQLEQLIEKIRNIKYNYLDIKNNIKIIDYNNIVSQINYII